MSYLFIPERIHETKEMKFIDFMEKLYFVKELKNNYLGQTKFLE